jgi:hypothetical protein
MLESEKQKASRCDPQGSLLTFEKPNLEVLNGQRDWDTPNKGVYMFNIANSEKNCLEISPLNKSIVTQNEADLNNKNVVKVWWGKFYPTNKRNPCPVCSDTKGKCRTTEGDLVLCMTHDGQLPGWHYLGRSSNDLWGKFLPESDRPAPVRVEKQEREPDKILVSAEKKDKSYRSILEQLDLSDRHLEDFQRRNLQQPEVDFLGSVTRSLPDGYLIPFLDVEGLYTGAQKRLDQAEGGRYRWHYIRNDWSLNNSFNEKPLAVWKNGSPVWIVEGTGVKPIVASIRHGITAIGAAGGQHYLSPKTLADTLEKLGKPASVVFCPDAGDIHNKHVKRRINKNLDYLKSIGVRVTIAWWNQDTKDKPDIDELPSIEDVQYLSPGAFWVMAESVGALAAASTGSDFLKWVREKSAKCAVSFQEMVKAYRMVELPDSIEWKDGDPVPSPQDCNSGKPPRITYRKGSDVAELIGKLRAAGWLSAVDVSITGEGKSHRAGEMRFDGMVWYIDTNHNNPSISEIEEGYANLWPRHSGLWRDKSGNVSRKPVNGEQPDIRSNCPSARLFPLLGSKNYPVEGKGNPICGSCQHRAYCGTDTNFFKAQRHDALSSKRIRADIHSLPSPDEWDYSTNMAIVEEATLLARGCIKASTGTLGDFLSLFNKIKRSKPELYRQLEPLEMAIADLLESKKPKFGLSHDEAISSLPSIPKVDLEELSKALFPELKLDEADSVRGLTRGLSRAARNYFARQAREENQAALESIPANALVPLLEVLGGGPGSIAIDGNSLTVTQPDERKRATIQALGFRFFLDATGNLQAIEAGFGLPKNSTIVIQQEAPSLQNLTVYQTHLAGIKTREHSPSAKKRIESYVSHAKELYPEVKVLGFKGMEAIDGWWGNHNRGTNQYKGISHILSIGLPYPHLGAVQSEYRAFFGSLDGFEDYYDSLIKDEVVQWVGRQRVQHFPDTQFHIDMLATWKGIDLDFLNQRLGIKVVKRNAVKVCMAAGNTADQVQYGIFELARQAGTVSQEAIANALGISQQAFSKHLKALHGNWSRLKKQLQLFLTGHKGKVVKTSTEDCTYEAPYNLASLMDALFLGEHSDFDDFWDELTPKQQVFYLGNLLSLS